MIKKYEKYKESGIEYLGKIPVEWNLAKFKYTDEMIMGQSPSSDDYSYEKNGFPFLQGNAEFGKYHPTPKIWCQNSNKFSDINDILISVRAPIGAINIADNKYGIGRGLAALRGDKHDSKFIYYFFLSMNEYLNSLGTGSTFTAISTTDLKDIFLPTLTKYEQTQIANFLDLQTAIIDDLIGQKEKLIALLKEKRQAIINEAVTKGLNPHAKMKDSGIEWLGEVPKEWKVITFKRMVKIRNGKDQKPVQIEEGGYPVLGTGGEFGRASEYLYDKPSVLLGRKGTIDKPQFIEVPFWTVDTLFYTEINNDCDPLYVYYLSQQIPYNLLQESSAVPSMTQDNLNNVILCKPPLKEQQEISVVIKYKLVEFDGLIEKSNFQIGNLKSYRQSLISEAVTGKIDVRDWKPTN